MIQAQTPFVPGQIASVEDTGRVFARLHDQLPNVPHRFASRLVTAAHTMAASDDVALADATGGAFSVSLPTASLYPGRRFTVVRTNAGANAVTVGAGNVLGGNIALAAQYDRATVQSCLTVAPATFQWVRVS